MGCNNPITGYRGITLNPSGKRPIVFNKNEAYTDMPIDVPCGRCMGCRLSKSRTWALRCMHEASLYDENCFITLTFDEKHINKERSLNKKDFTRFIKNLRRYYPTIKIRYFHCGEYGDQLGRPHHHACLFNFNFEDKETISFTPTDNELFISPTLAKLWPYGNHTIGELNFDTAAYVARYVTKKFTNKDDKIVKDHYGDKIPEYASMSRMPGIGKEWIKKHTNDVYNHDKVITLEKGTLRPPKYYDHYYELTNPEHFSKIKALRKKAARTNKNNTPDIRDNKERCLKHNYKRKARSYETSNI